jgi:esterase/lipase superfamily enzyme
MLCCVSLFLQRIELMKTFNFGLMLLAAAALLVGGTPAQAGWVQLSPKLLPTDSAAGYQFGNSVALDGNIALVGSPLPTSSAGSAYLFNTSTGAQLFKLTASDAAAGDNFGNAVALSGNLALIGSHLDDDNFSNSGSAYLFNAATGAQIAKLKPNDPAASDNFGFSVALSGNLALIGSHLDDDKGINSGSAYLFNTSTGAQLFKLTASDGAASDQFGRAVALSGNLALIGSPYDDDKGSNSGGAYLFDTTTGAQLLKLLPTDGAANYQFGNSVAISGNLALVGSPLSDFGAPGSAYLFDATTGAQLFKFTADDYADGDNFGISVALSGDIAIIGSYLDDDNGANSGSAYLFDVTTGEQIAKIKPTDGAAGDNFGFSVAISGNTALVGSRYDADNGASSGSAYLFAYEVPEPSAFVLLGMGLIGLGVATMLRRRKSAD